ncbi:ParB N-terminal domain-containing protein [Nocardia puris]|uniref:ParB N-terminal domain-containing protein n=1 Tax=Nocardia puris TaxID=208602 RepID=UPI001892FE25|nr:ParB N-terminal domain-containing protein [Nocardia puris]MBF6460170.1 ParB N-terminal domain-containing protein [Nocardia puris]
MTLVPIADLIPYPGNARVSDLDAIADSLRENGQYRPIVVQRSTNYVLTGNHTMEAAETRLGWKEIDVHYIDVDDERARRIVLADNRTADKGHYDVAALAELLQELPDLDGTGYTDADLDALLESLEASDGPADEPPALGNPIISYNLIFDDEQQQDVWFEFTKWLKRTYSDRATVAERLTEYLEATAGDRG